MPSLEYFAGFFDADGCVNATAQESYRVSNIRVTVANIHRGVLEHFRDEFDGNIYHQRTHIGGWFKWVANGHGALKFLRAIEPYSIVKRDQIIVALQFPMSRVGVATANPEATWNDRVAIKKKLEDIRSEIRVDAREY